MIMSVASLFIFFAFSIQCGIVDSLTHLSDPVVRWKAQLGLGTIASAGLKQKNALVLSNDGLRLYATLDDGSLSVLDTSTGNILSTYAPPPTSEGWSVSNIGSGASISSTSGDVVYAVQDSPPPFRWNGTFWYQYEGWFATGIYNNSQLTKVSPAFYPEPVESSRIISLDYEGKQRWMNTLNGFVVGTPIYGSKIQADGSKLVYVLHNVKNIGQFTILMENSNGTSVRVLYNEVSKDGLPFSPMTKIRSQLGEDVLYWVSTMSTDPGYDPRGRIHRVIVRPSLQIISSNARHEYVGAATRPLLNTNGTSVWVAGTSSRLYKLNWQANASMWKGTVSSALDWNFQMDTSLRNETMPVMASPILSSDGNLLFASSTTTTFYCLHAPSGTEVWRFRHKKRSIYMTESKLSPDDKMLYSILFMDGTVIAQDAATGSIMWELSCENMGGGVDCQDSVEAEFILSPDGTQLYFGDFKGRIVSLTVAVDVSKSSASSAPPTSISRAPASQKYATQSVSHPVSLTPSTVTVTGYIDINSATAVLNSSPSATKNPVAKQPALQLLLKPTAFISSANPSASSSRGSTNTGSTYAQTLLPISTTNTPAANKPASQSVSNPSSFTSSTKNTTKCTDGTSTASRCTLPTPMTSSPAPGQAAPQEVAQTHLKKPLPVLNGTQSPTTSASSTLATTSTQPSHNRQHLTKIPLDSPSLIPANVKALPTIDNGELRPKPNNRLSPYSHHQPIAQSSNLQPIASSAEKPVSSQSLPTNGGNNLSQKPNIQVALQPAATFTGRSSNGNPQPEGKPTISQMPLDIPTSLSLGTQSPISMGSGSNSSASKPSIHPPVHPLATAGSSLSGNMKPGATAQTPSTSTTEKWANNQSSPSSGMHGMPSTGKAGRNFGGESKSVAIVPAATASAVVIFCVAVLIAGYAAFQMYKLRKTQRPAEETEVEK